MTKRSEAILALIWWGILAGCSDQDSRVGGMQVTETDSAGVVVVTISGAASDLPLWTLSDLPMTEISGEAPPFLGSVGEVEILSDGQLLVEDNQTAELRRFDQAGAVVKLLGGRGDGPGEFRNLTELTTALHWWLQHPR